MVLVYGHMQNLWVKSLKCSKFHKIHDIQVSHFKKNYGFETLIYILPCVKERTKKNILILDIDDQNLTYVFDPRAIMLHI